MPDLVARKIAARMPILLDFFAFVSGFAASSYQLAWTRMLSMTFGSSILAASAVVACFMGGTGIGTTAPHFIAGVGVGGWFPT